MPNVQRTHVNGPDSLSKVRGDVVWFIEPPDRDLSMCRSVISALVARGGEEGHDPDERSTYAVEKADHSAILLRCCDKSRQFYFKVFLPRFSWRWRRGLRVFTPPAVRQSQWFARLHELGVGVVDLVGVAVLPWKRRFSPVQPISMLITSSPRTTDSILHAMSRGILSPTERLFIARTVLDYTETLHGNRIGHIDMLAANILYDAGSRRVMLCDLDRFTSLRFGNVARRIQRDSRKVTETLRLLLSSDDTA